jgi:hypothetical protein
MLSIVIEELPKVLEALGNSLFFTLNFDILG